MRQKPKYTRVSDIGWAKFNDIADRETYGIYPEDWSPWFQTFEAGYEIRLEEEE